MSTIVVTGAAGFIGSHTVDQLLADGCDVVGIDNFRAGRRENLARAEKEGRFRFEDADCADAARMNAICAAARPEAVIHLAALVNEHESFDDPDLNFQINVHASHVVAEAARRAGTKRLVFASSAAVYGAHATIPIREEAHKAPITPHGAAKLAAERLLLGYGRGFGMTVLVLRYFNVFGPRQDSSSPHSGVISIFTRRFREGRAVTINGNGRQTRDFVSVHDVAHANVLAATSRVKESSSQNICTGKETSLMGLVQIFGRHYPKHETPVFAAPRAGDIARSCGIPARAKHTIGFWAEVDIASGLRELIQERPLEFEQLDPRAGFHEL